MASHPVEYGHAHCAMRKDDVDLNHSIPRAPEEIRGDGTLVKLLTDHGFSARNLWFYATAP